MNQPNLLEKLHGPLDKYCLDSVVLVIFFQDEVICFPFLAKKRKKKHAAHDTTTTARVLYAPGNMR